MTEVRFNPITGDPVILSTARADRPGAWSRSARVARDDASACPFCPGNEMETPPEIERIGATDWSARVVPNKYPAISHPEGIPHEVVIDSPDHGLPFEKIGLERLTSTIELWKRRVACQASRPGTRYVSLFRNEGRNAGESIPHPHSQILGLDFVPPRILREFGGFMSDIACPLCTFVEDEVRDQELIIDRSGSLVLLSPRAARVPFEMWIIDSNHMPNWYDASATDLASLLLSSVARLRTTQPGAAFNLGLITAPLGTAGADRFHWYAEVTPRLTGVAGFEMSTGVWINIESPERAARTLRQVSVRQD